MCYVICLLFYNFFSSWTPVPNSSKFPEILLYSVQKYDHTRGIMRMLWNLDKASRLSWAWQRSDALLSLSGVCTKSRDPGSRQATQQWPAFLDPDQESERDKQKIFWRKDAFTSYWCNCIMEQKMRYWGGFSERHILEYVVGIQAQVLLHCC